MWEILYPWHMMELICIVIFFKIDGYSWRILNLSMLGSTNIGNPCYPFMGVGTSDGSSVTGTVSLTSLCNQFSPSTVGVSPIIPVSFNMYPSILFPNSSLNYIFSGITVAATSNFYSGTVNITNKFVMSMQMNSFTGLATNKSFYFGFTNISGLNAASTPGSNTLAGFKLQLIGGVPSFIYLDYSGLTYLYPSPYVITSGDVLSIACDGISMFFNHSRLDGIYWRTYVMESAQGNVALIPPLYQLVAFGNDTSSASATGLTMSMVTCPIEF